MEFSVKIIKHTSAILKFGVTCGKYNREKIWTYSASSSQKVGNQDYRIIELSNQRPGKQSFL